MLISEKSYNKETTIERNIVAELRSLFVNKIVITNMNIRCRLLDKYEKEITDSNNKPIISRLMKGSTMNITRIYGETTEQIATEQSKEYSYGTYDFLTIYAECCADSDENKIQKISFNIPLDNDGPHKLKLTVRQPISKRYQALIDSVPNAEDIVSKYFHTTPNLIQKSERLYAETEKLAKSYTLKNRVAKIIGMGSYIIASVVGTIATILTVCPTIRKSDACVTAGIGISLFAVFAFAVIGGLIQCGLQKFIEEYNGKNKFLRKCANILAAEDVNENEYHDSLYKLLVDEEYYTIENASFDSLTDKKPKRFTIGKIKKEKHGELELYRTVDDSKNIFTMPTDNSPATLVR